MKRISRLVLLLFCCVLSGCTQPDGYIGDWFGSWHLEEIIVDGTADDNYKKDIAFNFQSKIYSCGFLSLVEVYGNWSCAGETLTLIAGYQDRDNYYVNLLYDPFPKVMQLPSGVDQVEITVTYINSRTMQWQHVNQHGQLMTYNFRKYP